MNYRMQLKLKRIELGLKQSEVDEMGGFSESTINKFEKGRIQNARIIERIAAFYGGRLAIEFYKKENS